MLKLLNFQWLVLENVQDVLMFHQLVFNFVLRVATVADFDACDKALTVDLRQTDGDGISTIYQKDNTNFISLILWLFLWCWFGLQPQRFSIFII